MESLVAVRARMEQIRNLVGPPSTVAPTSAPTGTSGSSFESILAQAQQLSAGGSTTTRTATLTPAERLPAGSFPPIEIPAELRAYGNGRIPADALEPIGIGEHRLYAPAAQAFRTMQADAAAAGVTIGVTDSYRDFDAQVRVAEEKGLYKNGGLAAVPGTSNHGWGLALDLDLDDAALAWMRDNGWRYGFVEDTPREPWHWGYRPA